MTKRIEKIWARARAKLIPCGSRLKYRDAAIDRGRAIYELIEDHGISPADVARALNLSYTTVVFQFRRHSPSAIAERKMDWARATSRRAEKERTKAATKLAKVLLRIKKYETEIIHIRQKTKKCRSTAAKCRVTMARG